MNHDLISVVVPVYNASHYIEKTIQMVQAQTYTNWELILVDDCSKDDSVHKIEAFLQDERIHLLKQETNQGAAAARNRGIKEAGGEYLAFLDADDVWLPEKLEKTIGFAKKNSANFVFTAYEFGDEDANPTGKIVEVPTTLTYKKALSRTVIFTSTVLFNLHHFSKEQVTMPLCKSEDTATWWKILRTGETAYGLNEVLSIYRRPAQSLSSNKVEALRRIWNLYRKQEHLNVFASAWYFCGWAVRATLRRI